MDNPSDGERAFDTGQFVQKFIFGIYGTKNAKTGREITAKKFDSNAKNLLGCATSRTGSGRNGLPGK